ncbi:4'-phosphopantetheinyl transferase family protein [Dactylosporangium matsuzakiense]|uniref:4'-phosphopantetheinyl transferase n=1 Tax=Dactylosporangium matsuzakiense TaxID=53360 RepID=A0A9W6NMP9_9ACTN|nr:4'-phosphopantetheinyl transferase superfamily protein [Dactylosporangium matsuzakiense]UWZ43232.1 4'-phosphopantetheinyl transferase superfamily protein [Dactylosporangium matsuzakiense]GLL02669.1 4'-phosphopantetheinyl transferase [Dactylosporangium matsuzakiense]
MRDLLPEWVAVEVAGEADYTAELLPDEAAALSVRAVSNRRREFTAGRSCARRALARLGVHGKPLVPSEHRAPVWPQGTTGSITHTAGYCAAAVALSTDVRAVGIDAERRTILPQNVRPAICLPEELAWCARRPDEDWWPAVHFSAKEVVYKLWSPIMGTWLDFMDARLTIDVVRQEFEAEILPEKLAKEPGAPKLFRGRFHAAPDLVRSAGVVIA